MTEAHVTPGGPTHVYAPADGLEVRKFSVGQFDNNVYVVRSGDEALVIDGSAGSDRVLPELGDARPVGIVITHSHPDHTQKLRELREGLGDPPVYGHPALPGKVTPVADGEALKVGDTEILIMFTPGHTPDSICLLARDHLFSGDTLFPGGPGNTGNDAKRFQQVMESLDRLFDLPDDTAVHPGHGDDTTIGGERPDVETWRARGW